MKITETRINKLTNDILQEDFNDRIKSAEYLGRLLWHNQSGIFSLVDFERRLIDVSASEFSSFQNNNSEALDSILFVVSEPYLTGGHTRLMERLAKGTGYTSQLLVIRATKPEVIDRLKPYFTSIIETPTDCDSKKRIEFIVSKMRLHKRIVLNTHPDDILSVVACGILKKMKERHRFFYINHADHVFNYGASVADFWFQISAFGAKIDSLRNLDGRVTFLGIPLDTQASKTVVHVDTIKCFMTAGSAEKYKPVRGYSIFPLLFSLLKKSPNSTLVALGPNILRDYWWWPLKLFYFKRVKISKRVPFDKYMALTKKADVYVDSHPIPGGTAFAEQYLQGMICVGVVSPFQGYTPVELLKKKKPHEVTCKINSDEEEKINSLLPLVHGVDAVIRRFTDTLFQETVFKNQCEINIPWSGDINYNWSNIITSIPSDFPLKGSTTKFALSSSNFSAKMIYFSKKLISRLIKLRLPKKG